MSGGRRFAWPASAPPFTVRANTSLHWNDYGMRKHWILAGTRPGPTPSRPWPTTAWVGPARPVSHCSLPPRRCLPPSAPAGTVHRLTSKIQWWNDAQAQLLYREAKTLIDGGKPADDTLSWCRRGDALVTLGRHDAAISSFGRAIALDPRSYEALFERSRSYLHLGDWPKMLKDQERLLDLRPRDAGILNELAWRLCSCPDARYRDYPRAVELARRSVIRIPTRRGRVEHLGGRTLSVQRLVGCR